MSDNTSSGGGMPASHGGSQQVPDRTAELLGAGAIDSLSPLPVEVPGSRIGPYRLVQQIGEGGFGSVFLAEQEVPVRRSVAIKVVKLGMDTRQVVARFEQERQTLALMEHPNIARVLDAGTTESGRPYFVMELVKGDPIVEYCDKNSLSVRARIELVVDVCLAVQHAHTKGIIHRDIKPSNILIAMQDGRPCAKVIDFGIAKATSAGRLDHSVFTEQRQLIGTPQYMSPEQADGSLDIDTRTDIYSIGVLLYELLTGTTPFTSAELRSAALGELQRIIREVDPPLPSTRLAKSGETISGIAARRRTEPATLGATIRGELDWIVMKALEKDRTRRYESANDLAADIRRYLAGDAVVAAPPSRVYRLRKFVRRNRVSVGAGAAVAAALLLGAIAFAWQARVASGQRDRAMLAEEQQRARAFELKAVAEFQAKMLSGIDVAASGERLMKGIRAQFAEAIERAGSPESERAGRAAVFAGELGQVNATDAAAELLRNAVLRPAVEAIDAQFASQPLVDAALRHTLSEVFLNLGSGEEALSLAQRALDLRRRELGVHDRETLASLERVAMIVESLGKVAEAEAVYREAYELRMEHFGPDDRDTLVAMGNLGNVYRAQGKMAEAEPLLRDALAGQRRVIGNESRTTLIAMNTMGFLYATKGEPAKAEPLWREAYETGKRVFGENDPDVIVWTYNLGGLLQDLGKLTEAESLFRIVLEKYRRLYGESHPSTITVLRGVCGNLVQQGRFADAEPLGREAFERSRESVGPEHPITLMAMTTLGSLLFQLERHDEAVSLLRETLASWQRTVGDERIESIVTRDILGRALVGGGHFEEVAKLYAESVELAKRVLGPEHPQTLTTMVNAGNGFLLIKRPADAEPLLVEVLAVRRRVSGEDHRETLLAQSNLGLLYEQQGKLAEAESTQRDALTRLQRVVGPDQFATLHASMNLATVLRKRGNPTEAVTLLRAAKPALERRAGAESIRFAGLRLLLGQALTDLGQYADAAAELAPAVERIAGSPTTLAVRRRECFQAMAALHEGWAKAEPGKGHDAEAEAWRAKAEAVRER
ncbi:MAG: serine/threonine protein kinase [Phycisphaerae bacterium]|nr:serine/threonine protein kinase [Phycisphaerae bacterium]